VCQRVMQCSLSQFWRELHPKSIPCGRVAEFVNATTYLEPSGSLPSFPRYGNVNAYAAARRTNLQACCPRVVAIDIIVCTCPTVQIRLYEVDARLGRGRLQPYYHVTATQSVRADSVFAVIYYIH